MPGGHRPEALNGIRDIPPPMSHPARQDGTMRVEIPISDWFFPVEEVPVEAVVTRGGQARRVRVRVIRARPKRHRGRTIPQTEARTSITRITRTCNEMC